jgi:hypothetical protein
MITLACRTIAIALLLALMLFGTIIGAHAQREIMCAPLEVCPNPDYRAINHDPATGRSYSREADYLTSVPAVLLM